MFQQLSRLAAPLFLSATTALAQPVEDPRATAPEPEARPTPNLITGKATFNFVEERIHDGDIRYNPLNEVYLNLNIGPRILFNMSYDANIPHFLAINGGRIEEASLGYKFGAMDKNGNIENPLILTGGLLGEMRLFEVQFYGTAGRMPINSNEPTYFLRVDNNTVMGAKIDSTTTLGNGWSLHFNGAAFASVNPVDPSHIVEDHANSGQPSYTGKAAFRYGSENNTFAAGLEGGLIQDGKLGDRAERYISPFISASHTLSPQWKLSGIIQPIFTDNSDGFSKNERTLTLGYGGLEWRPSEHFAVGGSLGALVDSASQDALFYELGARYDTNPQGKVNFSIFGGTEWTQPIEEGNRGSLGYQFGIQCTIGF